MAEHFYNGTEPDDSPFSIKAFEAFDKMQSYIIDYEEINNDDGTISVNEVYSDEKAYNKAMEE